MVAGTYGRGVWRKNLGAGDCVDFTDLTIDSFLDWNGSPVCFNITVTSGGTLNITGSVVMAYRAQITVESNGLLILDGELIENGKITVEDGGKLEISNNGLLILNYEDQLMIESGGELEIESGEIRINTNIY